MDLELCGISSVTYHSTGGTCSVAKRLECAQLAAAMERSCIIESGTAILQLFTFGGLGIWATIDWILILCKAFKDKKGRRITKWT